MAITERGSDATLVRRLRDRDQSAWEELYDLHSARIYAFAYRLTGNPDDAADLVQETFLRAVPSLARLDPEGVDVEAYLLTTTRNIFYKSIGRAKRAQPVADVPEPVGPRPIEGDPERSLLLVRQQEEVRLANARLPPRQRLVLALRELEGKSYAEIGLILGLKENAVAQLISRARQSLRQELRLAQVDPEALPEECRRRYLPRLSAYVDGQLKGNEQEEVRYHLEEERCEHCRRAVAALLGAQASYRALVPPAIALVALKEPIASALGAAGLWGAPAKGGAFAFLRRKPDGSEGNASGSSTGGSSTGGSTASGGTASGGTAGTGAAGGSAAGGAASAGAAAAGAGAAGAAGAGAASAGVIGGLIASVGIPVAVVAGVVAVGGIATGVVFATKGGDAGSSSADPASKVVVAAAIGETAREDATSSVDDDALPVASPPAEPPAPGALDPGVGSTPLGFPTAPADAPTATDVSAGPTETALDSLPPADRGSEDPGEPPTGAEPPTPEDGTPAETPPSPSPSPPPSPPSSPSPSPPPPPSPPSPAPAPPSPTPPAPAPPQPVLPPEPPQPPQPPPEPPQPPQPPPEPPQPPQPPPEPPQPPQPPPEPPQPPQPPPEPPQPPQPPPEPPQPPQPPPEPPQPPQPPPEPPQPPQPPPEPPQPPQPPPEPPPPSELPDLAVVKFDGTSIAIGNIGAFTAGFSIATISDLGLPVIVPPLRPGGVFTIPFLPCPKAERVVVVDSTNRIEESNEGNNTVVIGPEVCGPLDPNRTAGGGEGDQPNATGSSARRPARDTAGTDVARRGTVRPARPAADRRARPAAVPPVVVTVPNSAPPVPHPDPPPAVERLTPDAPA